MSNGFKKTINWYDKYAKEYAFAGNKYASPAQINDFVRFLKPKSRVLDAGCGFGRDTNLLTQKGLNVVGLDLSSGLIQIAKKKLPQINFIEGNFLTLPFNDKYFDGVWAHASLVHLESVVDVKKALKEFNRVLKPEGILHLTVRTNIYGNKFGTEKDKNTNTDRFFQYFSKDEIEILTKKSGFSTIKLYQFKDPNSAKKYDNKLVEWIRFLGRKNIF